MTNPMLSLTLERADAFTMSSWLGGLDYDDACDIMGSVMEMARERGGDAVCSISVAEDATERHE